MKPFLTIFALLFLTSQYAFGECGNAGISVFPQTKSIPKNGIFIIEGYASSQDVILELNKKHAVYLTSGKDTIALQVFKTLTGQYRLTQALLKPAKPLISGKHYQLNIDSLDEYDKADLIRDSVNWTVSFLADTDKPVWKTKPSFNNKGKIFYGCGPAVWVNICVCISDQSAVVVYTKIRNIKTNATAYYYVEPESSYLELGHGMCAGEFDFEDGQEYEASFWLMDASGNMLEEAQSVKFVSPADNELIEDDESTDCHCSNAEPPTTSKNLLWVFIAVTAFIVVALVCLKKK